MHLFDILTGFQGMLFIGILIPVAVINYLLKGPNTHYVFAYASGTFASFVMQAFVETMKMPDVKSDPFTIALAILMIVFLWKFMFGPWSSRVKATVLGVFIFWFSVGLMQEKESTERVATILATFIAMIPAGIWCVLFLKDHWHRFSVVLLTFFAGMLSTAPILFYDYVVKRGYELHFFLFKITPENFMRTSDDFVAQTLSGTQGVISASVLVTLVSYVIVGVIEEWSKHWVTRKSDPSYFSSVGDVIQLSIVAGIGFAFAENIINPHYFIAFVMRYLVEPSSPQIGPFLGSIMGRAIITNMVHISCSGILGYFYGLAFFAKPALEEARAHGKKLRWLKYLNRITRRSRIELFKNVMMIQGLVYSMVLHGLFDTAVSLPSVLPSRPRTLGALFDYSGPLSGLAIELVPAIIYVFGGFALLSFLLHRKADIKEYGFRLKQEVFVNPVETSV